MSSRLPSLLTVEDDLVEAEVLSESMIGGDDDTNLHLSSRNTLGHKRNRSPKLKQPREIVRKNTSVGMEAKWGKHKMAESSWMVRADGVSEARVHGVPMACVHGVSRERMN